MQKDLYDPSFEHDACGVGFVARLEHQPCREVVDLGLSGLANLHHRGATGSDTSTGDGAGILLQMPDAFMRQVADAAGIHLTARYGAGLVFLPRDLEAQHNARAEVSRIAAEEGCCVLGWRDVPVNHAVAGELARACEPVFAHLFVGTEKTAWDAARFERVLYVVRKRIEHALAASGGPQTYIVSLSSRTLTYKGMLTGRQLAPFFDDLNNPHMVSKLAVVHQRFSTNTLPSWSLAQPFRHVAHNGEFNTVRGNINWMRARQVVCSAAVWGDDLARIMPVVRDAALDSDTATFDAVLELLLLSGRTLPHALMMMIPEAWQKHASMSAPRRAFYQYHSALMEAWDGPAAVAFTDGRMLGAMLDRNGLRPARYLITHDKWVVLASEAGVFDIAPERIAHAGRIEPGRMLLLDTETGTVCDDNAIKDALANEHPYARWHQEHAVQFAQLPIATPAAYEEADLARRQTVFGITPEELRVVLSPMALRGEEPLGSMGYDAPLAILSSRPRLLFDYFKQAFAQVTNPPLDAIREEMVTALASTLGPEANLLATSPAACAQIELPLPVLNHSEMAKIYALNDAPLRSCVLDITYRAYGDGDDLQRALEALSQHACEAIRRGDGILILSDRQADAERAPIPSLLATSAIHHHLVREGLRTRCGLVVDCGDAREVHHIALLLGYGAGAVHPHLACDSVTALSDDPEAVTRTIYALCKGVLKVMSKMGICTLQSYCGAQLFEAVGIDSACIERYFTWTPSRIGGIDLNVMAQEVQKRHDNAYAKRAENCGDDVGGDYQWRQRGEYHLFNPDAVLRLQHATRRGQYRLFKEYTDYIDAVDAPATTLRSMLSLEATRPPLPLSAVEPVQNILKRFATGAMSYGSISGEAHETLAVAMNRIGGKSNCGEGGEDPARFVPDANGDSRRSAIKQVASGRFGVTSHYLVNATDIQIKIAQGAKPGEGGQLPGHKVVPWIAKVRHATPGVGLISPPPHHDIYSIEDLAQLIYDLKNANPLARIHVKLVAAAGVGTIAAGVAKARADVVLISGYDGGTGAASITSLKHCGIPWELGVAEAQQVLQRNGLRDRVVLQVDGHIKTGRDVVVAALLGAEEFGFSTAALVVSGCIMMRVCHLNTCPVGIATQDPVLRERFAGKPEFVERYFEYVAEHVREIMASLGYATVDDMIGDTTALRQRRDGSPWKAHHLDLSAMLAPPPKGPRRAMQQQDHHLENALDAKLLPACHAALDAGTPLTLDTPVHNTDRAVGTRLGYELTRRHGGAGLPPHTLTLRLHGTAGQSFAAFVPRGITLLLQGDANDYVGKGLCGGTVAVFPDAAATDRAEDHTAIGNVALYGATSGDAFIAGRAGERFAVRNSGARAVVEGVGDHGCEYMTGGCVVILGSIGRNFAAGMSGGMAYLLGGFDATHIHGDDLLVGRLDVHDADVVRTLLKQHVQLTQSVLGQSILKNWRAKQRLFRKVVSHDYQQVLDERARLRAQNTTSADCAEGVHG